MKRTGLTLLLGVLFVPLNATAETTTVCTLLSDAKTGKTIIQEGKCETRATAASTFKIAISLMGFDSGILTDAHHPVWSFKEGYPDWRAAWRKDTDPQYWIEQSVVWYSQQINIRLGEAKFRNYVTSFDYGNADVSGDVAKQNGLMRSWLSSSLQISPAEQIEFVSKMIRGELPVSKQAREMAMGLFDMGVQANGWHVFGKTGAGLSQNADGRPIKGQPWGWFVGWATRGDQTIAFARLTHDSTRPAKSPGFAVRDAFMAEYFASDSAF